MPAMPPSPGECRSQADQHPDHQVQQVPAAPQVDEAVPMVSEGAVQDRAAARTIGRRLDDSAERAPLRPSEFHVILLGEPLRTHCRLA
jgi:hypothetical protein